jgi:hypothetical protein
MIGKKQLFVKFLLLKSASATDIYFEDLDRRNLRDMNSSFDFPVAHVPPVPSLQARAATSNADGFAFLPQSP